MFRLASAELLNTEDGTWRPAVVCVRPFAVQLFCFRRDPTRPVGSTQAPISRHQSPAVCRMTFVSGIVDVHLCLAISKMGAVRVLYVSKYHDSALFVRERLERTEEWSRQLLLY